MALNPIEVTQALFAADAEARRMRDAEWRARLAKVLDPEELDAAEAMYPPPDRRE